MDDIITRDRTALLLQLLHTVKTVEGAVNAALATVGLSSAKWSAMSALARGDEPLTFTQLAEQLTCVKSNVTQLVDRLEAEKLVRRVLDPADRRVIRAELTAEGWQQYEAGRAVIEAAAHEFLGSYSDEELAVLQRLLHQFG